MSVEFTDKGLGLISKKIADLAKLKLTVGFQGEKGSDVYLTGETVATVATFQEFGTQDIPQRAFLRSTMFEQRDKIVEAFARWTGKMIETPMVTPLQAMSEIGKIVVGFVERKVDTSRSWAQANAASTIRKKGFDYPLHETDKMAKSITWAVRGASGRILATGGSSG
jgi:hypothetical protein